MFWQTQWIAFSVRNMVSVHKLKILFMGQTPLFCLDH